eukprot:365106-Chlamydomonas_euryale.AAC.4
MICNDVGLAPVCMVGNTLCQLTGMAPVLGVRPASIACARARSCATGSSLGWHRRSGCIKPPMCALQTRAHVNISISMNPSIQFYRNTS